MTFTDYFFTRRAIIFLSFLNMLDAVLTVVAVKFGFGSEGNPLFLSLNFGDGFFFFIGIKLFISFFLLYAVSRLWFDWWMVGVVVRKFYLFSSFLVSGLYFGVCLNNLLVILF